MFKPKNTNTLLLLLPVFGIITFLILYVIATAYYPGGSQVNKNAIGFSWMNNYWCNLLNEKAINGVINPARPIAIFGMIVLCISLSAFWILLPMQVNAKKYSRLIVQICGSVSMLFAVFIFTSFHDSLINIACILGLFAIIGTFEILWKLKWNWLFWMGNFTLVLVAINNVLYYNPKLLIYLPLVQKFTFLYVLIWIASISMKFFILSKNKSYPSILPIT